MRKKKLLTILMVYVLVVTAVICIVDGIAAGAEGEKPDAEKMREMADRMEDAILSVDDSYKKQLEVVTYPLTYSYASGNTIVFMQCHTKYFEADPSKVEGMNMKTAL